MPYTVRKRKDEFCVVKKDDPDGKTFGCHPTEKEAQDQIAAIEANEHKWVTVEEMDQVCPDCAEHMRKSNLSKIDLGAIELKAGEGNIAQLGEHLLNKYGEPGLFTACMKDEDLVRQYPDDERRARICAKAHYWATGMWTGQREHREKSVDVCTLGGAVKHMGSGRVGGYLVIFDDGKAHDVTGQWFAKDTHFAWEGKEKRDALWDHGFDKKMGSKLFGAGLELKQADDIGLWVENQLDLADKYEAAIVRLAESGKLGMSSGTAQHRVEVGEDGRIKVWPIVEGSYTMVPAEPRTRGVIPLKSVSHTNLDELLSQSGATEQGTQGAADGSRDDGGSKGNIGSTPANTPGHKHSEVKAMDIQALVELIKSKLSLSEKELAQFDGIVEAFMLGAGTGGEAEVDQMAVASLTKALKDAGLAVDKLDLPGMVKTLKGAGFANQPKQAPAPARPPYAAFEPKQADPKEAAVKAAYHMRYGADMDDPTSTVMREIYGEDYRQVTLDQDRAFVKYLRFGEANPILKRQLWSIQNVKSLLQHGLSVAEIKATMVEGQDTLGGYAVPPQRMDQVLTRIAGLTAVRGGGALIVQTVSNMIEWPKVTGHATYPKRWPSVLAGTWGDETTAGTTSNFTMGLEQIPVNVYSYPVVMSRSLLEDAANVEDIFFQLVSATLAVDEDNAFLVGDGANKPRGILPDATNTDSLDEVVSQAASALTWAGLKALRRGIAAQYRSAGSSWIANSATGSAIEQLLDGISRDYVNALTPGQQFPYLAGVWRESEALPDITASYYPIIYGDLSGYAIVERLGMSIDRFHDSNTGTKKYQFEVYRRLGGRVIEPWKLCVQKISAT